VQNNFISKSNLNPLIEDISKLKEEASKDRFEMQSYKDVISRTETKITTNHAEHKAEDESIRARIEANEQTVNSLKKMLALLDERLKSMGKAAAMSGNTAMAGNLLQDLEDGIAKLRVDLDSLKTNCIKNQAKVDVELNQKATKDELAELEGRMMQRLQELFDQMRNMFPDKDVTKKKITAIEKNVSFILTSDPSCAILDQKPIRHGDFQSELEARGGVGHVH